MSPGNIPAKFYQVCWDVIKNDIVGLFHDFHAGDLNVSRIDCGTITLLPKTKVATKIQQYRPICLLNYLYKLITKVLTVRIEPYAQKLISEQQIAFIKSRNIMTGVMILHEILHETKKKRRIKARNLKMLLYIYEKMADLKINFMKSEIFVINGDEDINRQYANIFDCQIGTFPMLYLGVSVSPSRLHITDWIRL